MGVLQKLSSFGWGLEAKLEREYVDMYTSLMGLPRKEATELVRVMLARVKAEISEAGNQSKPLNGYEILAAEKTSARVKAELAVDAPKA